MTISPDGPLCLRGDFEIVDAQGWLVLRDTRIALCRCGGSAAKSFCNSRHSRIGFDA